MQLMMLRTLEKKDLGISRYIFPPTILTFWIRINMFDYFCTVYLSFDCLFVSHIDIIFRYFSNNAYIWYNITRAVAIHTRVPLLSSFCSQYIYWTFADNNRFCGTNYGDLVCSCPFTCTYDTHSRVFWCYGYQWLLRSNYLWTLKCA